MGTREPRGSYSVSFVGVKQSEFSIFNMNFGIGAVGAKEFRDFQRGGDACGAGRNGVDSYATSRGAFTERGFFWSEEFRDVMARVEAFEHQERLILSSAPFRIQIDDQNFHERTVPERR